MYTFYTFRARARKHTPFLEPFMLTHTTGRPTTEITPEMRRITFKMAFAGHPQKDICLMLEMSVKTFATKKAQDKDLTQAYVTGRHYYFEWVKLQRYSHKLLGKPKIKGTHIGLIPFFDFKKTFREIMLTPYRPPHP